MHPEIQTKVQELRSALVAYAPTCAVSFNLSVNCESVESEFISRYPEQLKKAGVSMRNIAGEFIK